jgi:hypothetical protein
MARGVTQRVECLPSKQRSCIQTPVPYKGKKNKKERNIFSEQVAYKEAAIV